MWIERPVLEENLSEFRDVRESEKSPFDETLRESKQSLTNTEPLRPSILKPNNCPLSRRPYRRMERCDNADALSLRRNHDIQRNDSLIDCVLCSPQNEFSPTHVQRELYGDQTPDYQGYQGNNSWIEQGRIAS